MKQYEEKEVLRTFIGKGLMSGRITRDYYDEKVGEVCLELYLGSGDIAYMSVPLDNEGSTYDLETAQELAAVLNTFVAEIVNAKLEMDNG